MNTYQVENELDKFFEDKENKNKRLRLLLNFDSDEVEYPKKEIKLEEPIFKKKKIIEIFKKPIKEKGLF